MQPVVAYFAVHQLNVTVEPKKRLLVRFIKLLTQESLEYLYIEVFGFLATLTIIMTK